MERPREGPFSLFASRVFRHSLVFWAKWIVIALVSLKRFASRLAARCRWRCFMRFGP
jgi:hypothetical protein